MNAIMDARQSTFVLMKNAVKYMQNNRQIEKKLLAIEQMICENEELFAMGRQALDGKFECVEFKESVTKHKNTFVGKCKRFKKEIKDKIDCIKGNDAKDIRSIVRFCRHNLKNGTMTILKTMLSNIAQMRVPNNECKLLHKSALIQVTKQLNICDKLLCKLREYALAKEDKLNIKMKNGHSNGAKEQNDATNENQTEEEEEYHSDVIIFRSNE